MNTENLTPIDWPEVKAGDVLLHENGDRLTVAHAREFAASVAGSSEMSNAGWEHCGFTPYRKQPELPAEPGAYLDKDGDYWLLDRSGNWYDWSLLDQPIHKGGSPQNYAPFTRLVPMPTEEQIRETLRVDDSPQNRVRREWATAAVMALLESKPK